MPPNEIEKYFDAVALSGELGFAKPDPETYHVIAERLTVEPSECVMIDDQEGYCEGARLAGMQAVHFYSRSHSLSAKLESILQN